MSTTKSAASIIESASRPSPAAARSAAASTSLKRMWCETVWANLSAQAKALELPLEPYFDPENHLLDKEVNKRLWTQVVSVAPSGVSCPVLFHVSFFFLFVRGPAGSGVS